MHHQIQIVRTTWDRPSKNLANSREYNAGDRQIEISRELQLTIEHMHSAIEISLLLLHYHDRGKASDRHPARCGLYYFLLGNWSYS
ncbi:hypothetical protein D3C80_1031140 [compost metagenome]